MHRPIYSGTKESFILPVPIWVIYSETTSFRKLYCTGLCWYTWYWELSIFSISGCDTMLCPVSTRICSFRGVNQLPLCFYNFFSRSCRVFQELIPQKMCSSEFSWALQSASSITKMHDVSPYTYLPCLLFLRSPPRTPVKVVPQIRIELEPEDNGYFWRSKGTETTL